MFLAAEEEEFHFDHESPTRIRLESLAGACADFAERKGWCRCDWENFAYLHLECSEFIEALRSKGEDPPVKELADLLFVLLTTCASHFVSMSEAFTILYHRLEGKDICPKRTQDQETT